MNRELYIHTLRMLREQYEIARMDTVVETIDAALTEFERPTDSDCISRQAAIDAVRDRMGKGETNIGDTFIECFEMILNALPSAQPEIIRCKECIYYDTPHIDDKGERREYKDMPEEAFDELGTGLVSVEYGINVGGRCTRDYHAGYSEDKRVFVGEDNYCGRAERRKE